MVWQRQSRLDGGHVPPAAAFPAAGPLPQSRAMRAAARSPAYAWGFVSLVARRGRAEARQGRDRRRRAACCPTARRSTSRGRTRPPRAGSTCRPMHATSSCVLALPHAPPRRRRDVDAGGDGRLDAAALPGRRARGRRRQHHSARRGADAGRPPEPAPRCSSATRTRARGRSASCRVIERRADNRSCSTPPTCRRMLALRAVPAARGVPARAAGHAAPARRGAGGAAWRSRAAAGVARDRRLPAARAGEPQRAAVSRTCQQGRCCTPSGCTPAASQLAGRPVDLRARRPARRWRTRPTATTTSQACFAPLMADLRRSLSMVLEQTADPDRAAGPQVRRARRHDPRRRAAAQRAASCSR